MNRSSSRVCMLGVGLAAALLCVSLGHSAYVGGQVAPRAQQRGVPSPQIASPVVTRVVAPAPGSASVAWSACAVAGLAASFALGRAARPKKKAAAAPRARIVVAQAMGGATIPAALPQVRSPEPEAPAAELSDLLGQAAPVALPATPTTAPTIAPATPVFAAPITEPAASPLVRGLGHAAWQPRAERQRRTGRSSRGGERRERRRIGAKLQAVRVSAEPRVLSYDASKVPAKLQGGLQLRSFPCKVSGREAHMPSEVQGNLSTRDFGSQTLFINRMQRHLNLHIGDH